MEFLLIWWPLLVSLLILNILLFHANSFNTSVQLSCHEAERSALLQLKRSFAVDNSTCRYEDNYPKTCSWDSEGGSSNCCQWDGVECDEETGHVIALDLSGGCIYGSFDSNSTLFQLVHLRKLNLAANHFNLSRIPTSIAQLSKMTYLNLSSSFFFGRVPYEISHLSKLSSLDLSLNYDEYTEERFLKLISPNRQRSLVQNLTRLEILCLDHVDISSTITNFLVNFSSLIDLRLVHTGLYGSIPSSLGKNTQLTVLDLEHNLLSGYIPSSLQNLTRLTHFRIGNNQISGPIPSWLGNLTKLRAIRLSMNELHGLIPQSLSKLNDLESLYVSKNKLNGTQEFDMFLKMRRLAYLSLAGNKLSVLFGARNITATTLPNFKVLDLSSCNVSEFPDFLRHQNELNLLELGENSIYGLIPNWFWNSSVQTLSWFSIYDNFVTGFQNPPTVLPWARLQLLALHSNLLQGQLLIPQSSMEHYCVLNNMLSGEIPPLICNLSSIRFLDLSNNNFSGTIPHCLGSSSSHLLALNLRNNSFHGVVPLAFKNGSHLRMIDFSHNHLQGKLPRSLALCTMLEYLDFSNNQLVDMFPAWLGRLPRLKVLILKKNGLFGAIRRTKNTFEFPNLHVIDLSYNSLIGELPSEFIYLWNSRRSFEMSNSTYMSVTEIITRSYDTFFFRYNYSTTIMIKSMETQYQKIQEELVVVDLSSNKFSGEIPEFAGDLVALRSLNLSNNLFTGRIPSSIGNLSRLESLDLSHNMLSGEIPQLLTQLNFLQSFDVSYNNLTGPIPQGNQLRTFNTSSFEGNLGLCGYPLPENCKELPSADEEDDDDLESPLKLDWKFILAGAISGFVVGVALGDIVTVKRQGRFRQVFRRMTSRMGIRQW